MDIYSRGSVGFRIQRCNNSKRVLFFPDASASVLDSDSVCNTLLFRFFRKNIVASSLFFPHGAAKQIQQQRLCCYFFVAQWSGAQDVDVLIFLFWRRHSLSVAIAAKGLVVAKPKRYLKRGFETVEGRHCLQVFFVSFFKKKDLVARDSPQNICGIAHLLPVGKARGKRVYTFFKKIMLFFIRERTVEFPNFKKVQCPV